MMTQRSREEIISLILQSAEKGATQTTLMYETYLSHGALKEYLTLLLKKGQLQYLDGEMKFKTTSKGLVFLSSHTGIGDQSCSHQCKKCGVLYCCEQSNCQNPFHHAACNRCLQFFNSHKVSSEVRDDKITLSLH
jgi:predicted transcriptional regulator